MIPSRAATALVSRETAVVSEEVRARKPNAAVYPIGPERISRADTVRQAAALRRVASLVTRGAPAEEAFSRVVKEVVRLFGVDFARMARYESGGAITFVAGWGGAGSSLQIGTRLPLGGNNVSTLVATTGRPVRVDSYAHVSGALGVAAREAGIRSAVGTPIFVEGRLWGVMTVASSWETALPPGTEARLADFTEMAAMAIANAESRAALAASRARIVAAADESRRRIERDLHDGTQQQLVSLMLQLRAAESAEPAELRAQLARTAEALGGVLEELREISRGIHPAILSKGGLGPALRALADRSGVPVELDLRVEWRLPGAVEVAAYYVVSEALANAAKHACASSVNVELDAPGETVRLVIQDDGNGGADPSRGSGLIGLRDRIEALGGTLAVASPAGSGTRLQIEIPIGAPLDGRHLTPAERLLHLP